MNWISIKEELPSRGEIILTTNNGRDYCLKVYRDGEFEHYTCELCNISPDDVTHWYSVNFQPERSKREDTECFINCKRSMCDFNSLCRDHICKPVMRCSEHKG